MNPLTDMPVGLLPDMFNDHSELVRRGKYLYPDGVVTLSNTMSILLPYMLGLEEIIS